MNGPPLPRVEGDPHFDRTRRVVNTIGCSILALLALVLSLAAVWLYIWRG